MWRLPIPAPDEGLLSTDERARAASYASRSRAIAFVAARTALRHVLAAYLDVAPAAIPIMAERHQKPFVAADRDPPMRFNMAHRAGRMLIAVALRAEVGVDVELERTEHEVRAVERTVLSEHEQMAVAELANAHRHAAVLRQWVRREAVVKATGAGLRIPPATVDVGQPEEPASARSVVAGGTAWVLWDLRPWPEAIAAIATEPAVTKIRRFEWTPQNT